jgi:hypothetical protein
MKVNKIPRKTNFFVVVLSRDENNKISYENVVYTSKDIEECLNFANRNFTNTVTTSIKSFDELIKIGVSQEKLVNLKNPDIY